MKILFLDIDGVLNYKAFRDVNGYTMNTEHVLRLLHIVRETGCHIVISSNWRNSELKEITNALHCDGIDSLTYSEVNEIKSAIFSRTDDLISSGEGSRADEITSWINSAVTDGHCIDSWVSVDDLSLDLPSANFVQTDDSVGLTENQMHEIIGKLNAVDEETDEEEIVDPDEESDVEAIIT